MTVPSDPKWPYRPALLLAAVALLLAMGSLMSAGWIGTLLLAAAVVFALVAARHFWQIWRWQRGQAGK
jgi:hypothetical protein